MDLGTRFWHPPQIVLQGQMSSQRRERVWDRDNRIHSLIFDYYLFIVSSISTAMLNIPKLLLQDRYGDDGNITSHSFLVTLIWSYSSNNKSALTASSWILATDLLTFSVCTHTKIYLIYLNTLTSSLKKYTYL